MSVSWPKLVIFSTVLSQSYLIFVIFFTRAKFLENKIYTEKTRKLRQNTQKIAKFLRYYGKIHSKLPIFRVKSVKIYTGQKNLHEYIRGVRDKYAVCFGPFSRSAFLVSKKSLFLQKCQCSELLTVF